MHLLLSRHFVLSLIIISCLTGCRDAGFVYYREANKLWKSESIYTKNQKYDFCLNYSHKFEYYELLDMHAQERGYKLSYKSFAFIFAQNDNIQITRVLHCSDEDLVSVVEDKIERNTVNYSDSENKWQLRTNHGRPTIEAQQYFGVNISDPAILRFTVVDALQNVYEIDSFKFNKNYGIPFILPKKQLVISINDTWRRSFAGQGYVVGRNLLHISIFNLQNNQKKYYQIEMDEIFELGVDKSLTLRPLKTKEYSLPRIKDTRKPFKGPSSLETKG